MLKRSSEILLLLCLAGCASTVPQQQPGTPAPDAQATDVAGPAAAGSTPAVPAKPVSILLAPPLQGKIDEASERLMAGQKDKALALYAEVQQAAPEHVSA